MVCDACHAAISQSTWRSAAATGRVGFVPVVPKWALKMFGLNKLQAQVKISADSLEALWLD